MIYAYVFYDIPDDNLRRKVADMLFDFGFERIQKSVFFGPTTYNRAEELAIALRKLIGDEPADVIIAFVPPSFAFKFIIVKKLYDFSFEFEEVISA